MFPGVTQSTSTPTRRPRRIVRQYLVGSDDLAQLRSPRDDVVAERRAGHDVFECRDGPFSTYQRDLVVREKATEYEVQETIQYRVAVPYFGWLLALPVRWALRRHRPGDGRQPLWAPPQRLDPRASALMGTLAFAVLLSGFLANAPAELHTYAADEFGVDQLSQGVLGAIVRLGTVVAVAASVIADRRGRRRVLGAAMVLGISGSLTAAIAPNIIVFAGALLVTRTANATLGAMVTVLAIEEMPRGSRAWAVSVLAMSAALGAGVVVWAQPLAGLGTSSWRIVFVLPALMAPFVIGIMRRLPESKRFHKRRSDVPLRPYLGRIVILGGIFGLMALFLSPIDWFRNEYLRDEHGFSAARVSLFVLATATPGGVGLYFAGRAADLRGRRIVTAIAASVGLGAIVAVYNATGAALWWLALVGAVVSSGLLPALGVIRGELFPTSVRARAGSIAGVFGVVGGSVGILLAGWLRVRWGSFGPVMALLWLGPLAGMTLVWLFLTEGAGRELEDLNPEDAAPDP